MAEEKISALLRHSQQGATIAEEKRRTTMVEWSVRIGALLAILAIGAYMLLYFQTGAWQILVDIVGLIVGLICLAPAWWFTRRGNLDAAGYWILGALVIIFGTGELVWADATLLLTANVILLIILAWSILRPPRWGIWLAVTGLYIAYVVLINRFEPLPRYPILAEAPATQLMPIPLILVILWQIVRAFRIGTLRTRLLIAFVAVALFPAIAISGGTIAVGTLAVQQQMQSHLESVAVLKEAEIGVWLDTLQGDLDLMLAGEDTLRRVRVLLLGTPSIVYLAETHDTLQKQFQQAIARTGRFDELFLMNLDGDVILSTDPTKEHVGSHSIQDYFRQGLQGPYVNPPFYSLILGRTSIAVSRPVMDDQGRALGVIAGHANLAVLDRIMGERAGLGVTGETYLVTPLNISLTENRFGEKQIYVSSVGADQAIKNRVNGAALYDNYRREPVVGAYHWLPRLQVALLAEQTQAEAFQPVVLSLGAIGAITLLLLALAAGASLLVTRSIAAPLSELAETASQIAAGDLERTARAGRRDEIGAVAQAFNSMTARLRDLIASLEQRVADRTRELAQRSAYLEAAAEVGHAAASILDMDELLRLVVDRIRERFELYYVGLFLVDESGEWAVLRAGTGEASRSLLARGYRIRIGEGMIGWCIAHAEARIAAQAEADAIRLTVPELPDTRSEAALPLRSRGRVLGAISVQSDRPAAFDPETVTVLQTMADQVAVALDNARLFAESQAALEAVRRAYGELSREAWVQLLRARSDLGYRSDERGVTPARDFWRPEMERAVQEGHTVQGDGVGDSEGLPLAIPIKVRDQVLGVLDTYKPSAAGGWTPEEVTLLEAITDQVGLALESARLYQDAQRRAVRERLTREVTARMRETLDVDIVLRTATDEIYQALKLDEVVLRLATREPEKPRPGE